MVDGEGHEALAEHHPDDRAALRALTSADYGPSARQARAVAQGDRSEAEVHDAASRIVLPPRERGEATRLGLSTVLTATKAALAREAADLIYHLLVLLESRQLAWDDVLAELQSRAGTSGLAEKAARKTSSP